MSHMVEDSVYGVRAGVAGGMKVYGLAGLTTAEELAAEGAVVFHRMAELVDLLTPAGPRSGSPARPSG